MYVCLDTKSPAGVTVNGSIDTAADAAVVGNNVDGDDNRWEQVRSRNRTVFSHTVSVLQLLMMYSIGLVSFYRL